MWLSEWASCRFAYGPAHPTATHCLLPQEIQIGFGFTFLIPAYPDSPGQNPESRKMVIVVVVIVFRPYARYIVFCCMNNIFIFEYSFEYYANLPVL